MRRHARDQEEDRIRRLKLAKLHREMETEEEADRRRARLRARWRARMEEMPEEERIEYIRKRNRTYLDGRPDRVERHRELCRQGRQRWVAKLTPEQRAKLNEKARDMRRQKEAAMSTEQKEAVRLARREKLAAKKSRKKLKD